MQCWCCLLAERRCVNDRAMLGAERVNGWLADPTVPPDPLLAYAMLPHWLRYVPLKRIHPPMITVSHTPHPHIYFSGTSENVLISFKLWV